MIRVRRPCSMGCVSCQPAVPRVDLRSLPHCYVGRHAESGVFKIGASAQRALQRQYKVAGLRHFLHAFYATRDEAFYVERVLLSLGRKLGFMAHGPPFPDEGVRPSMLCSVLGLSPEETRDSVIAASLVSLLLSTSKLPTLIAATSPNERDSKHRLPVLISVPEDCPALPQSTKDALKDVLLELGPVSVFPEEIDEQAALLDELDDLAARADETDVERRRGLADLLRKRRRYEEEIETQMERLVEDTTMRKGRILRAQDDLERVLAGKERKDRPRKRRRCSSIFGLL